MGKEQAGKLTNQLDRRVEFKIITFDPKNTLIKAENFNTLSDKERLKLISAKTDLKEYRNYQPGDILKPHVYFLQHHVTELTDYSKMQLDQLAEKLNQFPQMKIKITAHPAAAMTKNINLDKAVETVKTYLVQQKGIEPNRLSTAVSAKTNINWQVDIKAIKVDFTVESF